MITVVLSFSTAGEKKPVQSQAEGLPFTSRHVGRIGADTNGIIASLSAELHFQVDLLAVPDLFQRTLSSVFAFLLPELQVEPETEFRTCDRRSYLRVRRVWENM